MKNRSKVLEQMKYETAKELGIDYGGYKGNLTSAQNGKVEGMMVKKLIELGKQQLQ
jgi:small acid-soluble spore protein D (minor alpha/beta-type SASP)